MKQFCLTNLILHTLGTLFFSLLCLFLPTTYHTSMAKCMHPTKCMEELYIKCDPLCSINYVRTCFTLFFWLLFVQSTAITTSKKHTSCHHSATGWLVDNYNKCQLDLQGIFNGLLAGQMEIDSSYTFGSLINQPASVQPCSCRWSNDWKELNKKRKCSNDPYSPYLCDGQCSITNMVMQWYPFPCMKKTCCLLLSICTTWMMIPSSHRPSHPPEPPSHHHSHIGKNTQQRKQNKSFVNGHREQKQFSKVPQ